MNSPFPSCLKPLFQSEAKCDAIDTKSCGEIDSFSQQRFCNLPRFERESFWTELEIAYSTPLSCFERLFLFSSCQ